MLIVYIPCNSEEEAEKISEALVANKLIACANIHKSKSIYEWGSKLEKNDEWVIFAKTFKEKLPKIEEKVKELHSYDIPCIISIPVDANAEYLNWAHAELK